MSGKRGWGGPSIREGSHPPPYMSIAHDLRDARQLLDEIAEVASYASMPLDERMTIIKRKLKKRQPPRGQHG